MAIGQYRVMMSGSPAGQHCPMSSRYTLPSAVAFLAASQWTCEAAVSFGYGGPKRQASGFVLTSMNQFPVRSKGAFVFAARAIVDGASALNCLPSPPLSAAAGAGAAAGVDD